MKVKSHLEHIATALEKVLKAIYGEKCAFALFVFPQDGGIQAKYVSNAERDDMLPVLRDVAEQLESGDVIGPTIGSA